MWTGWSECLREDQGKEGRTRAWAVEGVRNVVRIYRTCAAYFEEEHVVC